MLALHAFSGCDSTSAFIRKGKIIARKILVKHPVFVDVFGTLGETDDVPEGSQTELEKFVCCMYGKPSYKDVFLRMPLKGRIIGRGRDKKGDRKQEAKDREQ